VSGGVRVGRIGGVAVFVDLWWVLITLGIAAAMFVRVGPGSGSAAMPAVVSILGALMVLGSVLVHEVSHAIVARRLGIGVVSVSLFLFGGYSELEGEPARPRDELLVAGAGPAASLLLGAILAGLAAAVPESVTGAGEVLGLLAVVNLAVAVFNLLPGLPLDGGRVLRSALWRVTGDTDRATRLAARAGVVIGVLVAVSGVVAVWVAGTWVWLWNTAVGVFLVRVALDAGRSVAPLEVPAGLVVERDVPTVSRLDSARAALARHGQRGPTRPIVVVGGGRVVGVVDGAALEGAPAAMVGDVMVPIERDDVVDAGTPVGEVLDLIRATGRAVVVVRRGRTIGVIGLSDIDSVMRRVG
jgi:Zn-dependent protease